MLISVQDILLALFNPNDTVCFRIFDDKKRGIFAGAKLEIEAGISAYDWNIDYVLSHTCPYNTRPTHLFLHSIDQSTVDSSMEVWLQKIADRLSFKHWYFGHFHDDWDNGKYSMLYTDVMPFPVEVTE